MTVYELKNTLSSLLSKPYIACLARGGLMITLMIKIHTSDWVAVFPKIIHPMKFNVEVEL